MRVGGAETILSKSKTDNVVSCINYYKNYRSLREPYKSYVGASAGVLAFLLRLLLILPTSAQSDAPVCCAWPPEQLRLLAPSFAVLVSQCMYIYI